MSWNRGALALLLAAGCVGRSQAASKPDGGVPSPERIWQVAQVGNLGRLPGLTTAHKEMLTKQGFFLAAQDPSVQQPARDPRDEDPFSTAEATPARTRATQLFHVYERNDHLRFPGLVTADLAIHATYAYFAAVQHDLENHQLGPALTRALVELLKEANSIRLAARTPEAREAARRAALFWAVALRLCTDRAVIPAAMRATTDKLVKAIVSGKGPLPVPLVHGEVDLAQVQPRGHYTRSRELERYFRTMSWLGVAAFPVEGKQADIPAVALLARIWLGSPAGREGLERVMQVATFLTGGSDGAGLTEAAAVLQRVLPEADKASADKVLAPELLAKLQSELVLALPAQRRADSDSPEPTRQVRVLGRRGFEDAIALRGLLPALEESASAPAISPLVAATMGARGVAAMLGSQAARAAWLTDIPAASRPLFERGIEAAHRGIRAVPAERWSQDAYHGMLHALSTLLDPHPGKLPALLTTEAWRLRALQTFAGGWAELRHDTIVYGETVAAECDALELEPPPGWVEAVPELYRRLAATVRRLDKRLASRDLDASDKANAKPSEGVGTIVVKATAEKTKEMLAFLDRLADVADRELKGHRLDEETLTWLTTIGGTVEGLLAGFSSSDPLNGREDMAMVADVFDWPPSAQVLQAGIAQPDLIYAIIPSADGPVLARGAVMSYREVLRPQAERMTDEEWRKAIAEGGAPERPAWLAPLYAAPVGPVLLPQATQRRCGANAGALIESL